jgi:hypothetical protein
LKTTRINTRVDSIRVDSIRVDSIRVDSIRVDWRHVRVAMLAYGMRRAVATREYPRI